MHSANPLRSVRSVYKTFVSGGGEVITGFFSRKWWPTGDADIDNIPGVTLTYNSTTISQKTRNRVCHSFNVRASGSSSSSSSSSGNEDSKESQLRPMGNCCVFTIKLICIIAYNYIYKHPSPT